MKQQGGDPMHVPERIFSAKWVLTIVFVVVFVGLSTFYATARLADNTEKVERLCEARNEQIRLVNGKFHQLTAIFDQAIANPRPDAPLPSEESLRLYAEFKRPIAPVSCDP